MEKRSRPKQVVGTTSRFATGCGNLYVTINGDGHTLELFAHLGKAGGCTNCQLEGLTRSITLGLKYGVPAQEFIDQLRGLMCPSPTWSEGKQVKSCVDVVASALEEVENRK